MSLSDSSSQLTPSSPPDLPLYPHREASVGPREEPAQETVPSQPEVSISPTLLGGAQPSGGLVYDPMGGPSAWWTPIQAAAAADIKGVSKVPAKRRSKRPTSRKKLVAQTDDSVSPIEMVPMSNRSRLRKVDAKGQLVWPFELEAVLIAGLRKYHATTYRPRPSASRNLNRNKLVSEYIETMTGLKRTTKQIASRIQVLRESWKGKKEFALVAQPRELIEMGYLASLDDQSAELDLDVEMLQNTPDLNPVRTTMQTLHKGKTTDQEAHDEDLQEDSSMVHGMVPDEGFGHLSGDSMDDDAESSVAFNPYDLDKLGPPKSSLENTIPSSTLFFIRSTLQGEQGGAVIFAKCKVSAVHSSQHGTEHPDAKIIVEIDPASIRAKIDNFGESPTQRDRLGTKVHLLQSSVVWDDDETVLGRDAGLVERLDESQDVRSLHRYSLEVQLAARQALAAGQPYVIVVQTLSLLRASDSRMLDSWMVIWVVQTSSRHTRLELMHFSNVRGSRKPNTRHMMVSIESSDASGSSESSPSPTFHATSISSSNQITLSSKHSSPQTSQSPVLAMQGSAPLVSPPFDAAIVEPVNMTQESSFRYNLSPTLMTPKIPGTTDVQTPCVPTICVDHNIGSHSPDDFPESHMRGDMPQIEQFVTGLPQQPTTELPMSQQEYFGASRFRSHTPAMQQPGSMSPIPSNRIPQPSAPQFYESNGIARRASASRASIIVPRPTYGEHHQRIENSSTLPLTAEWVRVQNRLEDNHQPYMYHHMHPQDAHTSPYHHAQHTYADEMQDSISPISATSTSSLAQYRFDNHGHAVTEHESYSIANVQPRYNRRLSESSSWEADSYGLGGYHAFSTPSHSFTPGIHIPPTPYRPGRYMFPQDSFRPDEVMMPMGIYLPPTDYYPHHPSDVEHVQPQPMAYPTSHEHVYVTHPRPFPSHGVNP